MPDTTPATPIHVPLSAADQQLFATLRAESERLVARQNDAVTIILGHDGHDPARLAGWEIALGTSEIICTPPTTTDPA